MKQPKQITLAPYHGTLVYCPTLKCLRATYEELAKDKYPFEDDPQGGRYIRLDGSDGSALWLVWGAFPSALTHEVCHVLLHTCGHIGHNPTEGDGEPFCYMLTHLMREVGIE